MTTRRNFLKAGTGVAAAAMMRGTMPAAIATMLKDDATTSQRLSDGWEYLQSSLGGAWEVWHSE